jgi:hypothetical protein
MLRGAAGRLRFPHGAAQILPQNCDRGRYWHEEADSGVFPHSHHAPKAPATGDGRRMTGVAMDAAFFIRIPNGESPLARALVSPGPT